ncbi:serine-rich repeat containing protein [Striga asiatica]|uniref:Serine-rich repeat containing protein n=1 Tax=Striga asiatica TaxID=4170 RepID=A0A5A7QMK9_STRAF|nr:serine-rich repeat containing protein [Striga asiatica]
MPQNQTTQVQGRKMQMCLVNGEGRRDSKNNLEMVVMDTQGINTVNRDDTPDLQGSSSQNHIKQHDSFIPNMKDIVTGDQTLGLTPKALALEDTSKGEQELMVEVISTPQSRKKTQSRTWKRTAPPWRSKA